MSPVPPHAFLPVMIYKHAHASIDSVDRARREFRFVASRLEVDADHEVVIPSGIRLSRMKRNPVMLLEHDRHRPFARVEPDSLQVRSVEGAPALIGVAMATPPGVNRETDQAYHEMIHGVRNGISIGFRGLTFDYDPVLPGQTGRTWREVELHEISLVTLPSCASCVVTAKSAHRQKENSMRATPCDCSTTRNVSSTRMIGLAELEADARSARLNQEWLTIVGTHEGQRALVEFLREMSGKALREFVGPIVRSSLRKARGRVD